MERKEMREIAKRFVLYGRASYLFERPESLGLLPPIAEAQRLDGGRLSTIVRMILHKEQRVSEIDHDPSDSPLREAAGSDCGPSELLIQWNVRQKLTAIFFVSYLVLQIGLPIYRFFAPRPSSFGWQMFAGIRTYPDFYLISTNGESVLVEQPFEYFGNPRADLDIVDVLPKYLCETNPQVETVLIVDRNTNSRVRYSCP